MHSFMRARKQSKRADSRPLDVTSLDAARPGAPCAVSAAEHAALGPLAAACAKCVAKRPIGAGKTPFWLPSQVVRCSP
jgi:hypothetical protein